MLQVNLAIVHISRLMILITHNDTLLVLHMIKSIM